MNALHARTILDAHPRQRTDLLRRALRDGRIDPQILRAEADQWLELFRSDPQPGLRALLLVLMHGIESPQTDEMLRRGRRDRGDGVRLEAYRSLLERDRDPELIRRALADRSVELCLLGAQYRFLEDPMGAVDAVLELCRDELGGIREEHALRRCSEVLAEDFADPRALPGLRQLDAEADDEEGHLQWAIETLENRSTDSKQEERE